MFEKISFSKPRVFAFALTVAVAGSYAHAATYIQGLGVAAGTTSSRAYGINDSGEVVGTSGTDAFYYLPGSSLVDIGTNKNFALTPVGVSTNGTIALYEGSQTYSYTYTPAGGFTDIGSLGGAAGSASATASQVYGISGNGTLVGTSWTANYAAKDAFLYNSSGITNIEGPGITFATATGVNNAGTVVGFGYDSQSRTPMFIYTPTTPMTAEYATDPTGNNGQTSVINAKINSGGTVAVTTTVYGPQFAYTLNAAFRYTTAGGFVHLNGLDTFTANHSQKVNANGINDAGMIVGDSTFGGT